MRLYAVAFGSFLPPSAHVALPQAERVILRAMAREPSQRFPSMDDLARALLPFASASTRSYWEAVLEAASPGGAAAHARARVRRNPNEQVTRLLAHERAPTPRPQTQPAVLDVAGLFALLRQRPSVAAGSMAALTALAASVWTLEQSGALTLPGLRALSDRIVSP